MKFSNGITLVAFADDEEISDALVLAIQLIRDKRVSASTDKDKLMLRSAQLTLERLLHEVHE